MTLREMQRQTLREMQRHQRCRSRKVPQKPQQFRQFLS